MKDLWAEEVDSEEEDGEKLAYQRQLWKQRQKRNRNVKLKRQRKKYQRRNRARLKMQAKKRYRKYRINPAFKKQRKLQRKERKKRKRLASGLTLKIAMRYIEKKATEVVVDLKDLPNQVQKSLKKLKVRPRNVKVVTTTTFRPSMASAYGDGYRGFAVLVELSPTGVS